MTAQAAEDGARDDGARDAAAEGATPPPPAPPAADARADERARRPQRPAGARKLRDSNMELLRIVAMLMIVGFHLMKVMTFQLSDPGHYNLDPSPYFSEPVVYKRLILLEALETLGGMGNDTFLLISGYFMATRPKARIRLGDISRKLLLQLGFATLLLVCVPPLVHLLRPDLFVSLLGVKAFNSGSWFIGYYFIVILCAWLFLNDLLARLTAKGYAVFLLTLFAFTQFSWSAGFAEAVAGNLNTVLLGIFLYSLGGYIRKHDPFGRIRTWAIVALVAAVYALVSLSWCNATETRIEQYLATAQTDRFTHWTVTYDNYEIVSVLLAVCLFELFRRIHLPESRVLTFLGRSTFMVYLIHSNDFFFWQWSRRDWLALLWSSVPRFVAWMAFYVLVTFLVGVAAYALYLGLAALLRRCRPAFVRRAAARP